jgi:3,4-dihydroxy 2-butanone 4-phosphate synthase/GTP cyclohydrolase II
MGTNFTVSIEASVGVTTGISAADRALTIKTAIDPESTFHNIRSPGHVFPLSARQGGVLRRAGHTEAAVDLAQMAKMLPGGVVVEILNEDGSMARTPELHKIAKKFDLKFITIKDLIEYRVKNESLILEVVEVKLPTDFGDFKLKAYRQTTNGQLHLAIYKGVWKKDENVVVRVHSSCMTGDIFGSCM